MNGPDTQGENPHGLTCGDTTLSGRARLIGADQVGQYYTDYIQENRYLTESGGSVKEIISIVRDPETDAILSAQWQKGYTILDLVHGLKTNTEYPLSMQYSCFEDFSEIARSGAVFKEAERCDLEGRDLLCLHFYHSLNGMPDGRGQKQRHYFANKGPCSQGYGFSSGHVWM